MRFVRLEDPKLRGIESPGTARRMDEFFASSSGDLTEDRLISAYSAFTDKCLGSRIADELYNWCSSHYNVVYDEYYDRVNVMNSDGKHTIGTNDEFWNVSNLFFRLQSELDETLREAAKDHFRHDYPVGNFPCSKKRILLYYKHIDGKEYTVVYDPSIFFPDINYSALQKVACENYPEKRAEINMKQQVVVKKEMKTHFTIFAVAITAFLVSGIITSLINNVLKIDNIGLNMLAAAIIPIAIPAAIVSFINFLKSSKRFKELKNKPADSFVSVTVQEYKSDLYCVEACGTVYNIYSKSDFKKQVSEYYKYIRFRQMWAEQLGLENNWSERMDAFLKEFEPFIINIDDIKKNNSVVTRR